MIFYTSCVLACLAVVIQGQSINWQPGDWALSCDFFGNDFASEKIASELCGGRCASNPECTHFTWALWEGGTCFMKKGNVRKEDALFSNQAGIVCGITKSSGGGGDNGNGDKGDNGSKEPNDPSKPAGACDFKFGLSFEGNDRDYSPADYLTIWIGSESPQFGNNFNPYWHGDMLKKCKELNKIPVFYGYAIAFMARTQWGLKDCNVGTPSLCQKGADFIRAKSRDIVQVYKQHATEAAKILGRDGELYWFIEPDFEQYHGDHKQENGGVSGPEMRKLFDDIATAVKSEMPKSKLSWDISPWLSESKMAQWWGYFKSSPHIDFLHTSGGGTLANSNHIRGNELTWRFMRNLTGKKIFADTGYGVAGASSGHDYNWDDINNIRNRINDGVIAVTQANPRSGWKSTTDQLRRSLPKVC